MHGAKDEDSAFIECTQNGVASLVDTDPVGVGDVGCACKCCFQSMAHTH